MSGLPVLGFSSDFSSLNQYFYEFNYSKVIAFRYFLEIISNENVNLF